MKPITWKEVWSSGPGPKNAKEHLIIFFKGMAMGIADLIPGVSGGTVAFITGIYEFLLDAIASINSQVAKNLLTFRFKEALSKVHLRFILSVAPGILFSIFLFARLMHFLITDHPIPTWGLFFGMIAASIIIIAKEIESIKNPKNIFMIILGAVFAYFMVSLIPVSTPDELWFIFLCGVIGISAMILPGISGSFLLLILGKYEYITGMVKAPFVGNNFFILCVFASGALTGLLGFSKILNWFLKHYRISTMCFLTGILIGSLKKIWPWKDIVESVVIRGKTRVLRDANIFPSNFDNETILALVLIIVGFIGILFLESLSRNKKREDTVTCLS